jgi:nicotinamidase-related amidase
LKEAAAMMEENLVQLDPSRTAVVVVDLQLGVVKRKFVPYTGSEVVANAARLLTTARKCGATIVLVHVDGSGDGQDRLVPDADVIVRRDSLPSDYSVLSPELQHQPSDIVVVKRNWGAFYGTDLDLQLRRRKLSTLVMLGIAAEFGVESTARDAMERTYRQVFVSDAVASFFQESYDNCIKRIYPRMGFVRTTDQVIASLNAGAQA